MRRPCRTISCAGFGGARLPQQVLAHVANVGDTGLNPDGWAGRRGSGLAIEGFAIALGEDLPAACLSYQSVTAGGALSDAAAAGQYCGTRDKAMPIFGLRLRLDDDAAARFRVTYEAQFVDGSRIGPLPAPLVCCAPSNAPLEAFRVRVSLVEFDGKHAGRAPERLMISLPHAGAVADAKRLMRLARLGAIATIEPETGAPLVTLVGVASDFDGAPLFLMSTLSRHTKHLMSDPRASLLLTGEPERGDPLNHPRVTLSGWIETTGYPIARRRYLQRNPKAKLYADFGDFAFFRLAIESVHFNGGFGRADPLQPGDILSSREGEAALMEAEPRLIGEINARGDEAVARLAGRKSSGRRVWRAIGLDSEGLDLSAGARTARLQFATPAHDEAGWRARIEAAMDE